MAENDFQMVTGNSHPIYSEDQPTYDAAVGAKKRQFFTQTYPAPKDGHAVFGVINKAGFKDNEGDALSIRISFECTKRSYTGNVGIFMHMDKAKLLAHQAGTNYSGSAGGSNTGSTGFQQAGGGLMFIKNAEGKEGRIRIGEGESDPSEFPANVGSSNDFNIGQSGDYQCMRMDYIPYTQGGVEMVKLEIFMSKKGHAWLTDPQWRDPNYAESTTTNVLRSFIFDKNGNGPGGNQHGSDSTRPLGDPLDGTGACHGFYFGALNADGANQRNEPSNSSDQSAASSLSIGKVEMRVVENTDAI